MDDFVIRLLIRTYLPRDDVCMPRLGATCLAAVQAFRPMRVTVAMRLYDRDAHISYRWRLFVLQLYDRLEPPDTAHHWRRIVVLLMDSDADPDEYES